MRIKNKISIELLDWLREDLQNENLQVDYKKLKKIMDIAIKHNKNNKIFFSPYDFYKFNEKENKLYYYYHYLCMGGIIKESYEVKLK